MAAAALAYIRTETIPENNTGNEPDDDDDFFDTDVDTDTSTTSCSSIFTETLDYSYRNLSSIPEELLNSDEKRVKIRSLQLNSNSLLTLPAEMFERFLLLTTLEISNNQIVQFPREICLLKNLKNLFVKNNCLDDLSLPKEMEQLQQLEIVNFGGNRLKQYPYQLFQLTNLKEVYLGSNQIAFLPNLFDSLSKVEVLYLGGNQIPSIPDTIGLMKNLIVLNLSGNRLKTLPSTISHLTRLKSLSLHNNQFSTLPPDIIRLDLQELSLRNNPLIVRFVRDLTYEVPTLKELSARAVKIQKLQCDNETIPKNLVDYLSSAKSCVNPKCKGVYFENCHKNIKFVDFCGKFQLPLLQFLCSPSCTTSPTFCCTSSDSDTQDDCGEIPKDMSNKFKKILLG